MVNGIVYTPKKHYKKKSKIEWYCHECFKSYAGFCLFGMTAIVPYPTKEKCQHTRHISNLLFLSSNNHVGAGGVM